jgi:hypothetical protein
MQAGRLPGQRRSSAAVNTIVGEDNMLGYIIGVTLGFATVGAASLIGFEKRTFYSTLMIVIVAYYWLFAVMGGSAAALAGEVLLGAPFLALAVLGFRRNLMLVVVALFMHGVMDFFHGGLVSNPGVPAWWPAFCGSIDVTMAILLAWIIRRDAARPGA